MSARRTISFCPAVIYLVLGFSASCSPHDACVPGQQVSCPCAGGGTGVQVCREDRTGYEPCGQCSAPTRDASSDTGFDTGVDATVDVAADAAIDAPDTVQDAVSTDVPVDAIGPTSDAPTTPFCTVTSPNCGLPAGAPFPPGACCLGTICDSSSGTPRCCVEHAHPCSISSDCCDSTEVCYGGVCSLPPGCRNNGQECGPAHPEVTGCCSSTAICQTNTIPAKCCQPVGTACGSDADCCFDLTCGADGLCHAPSCVPTNDLVECAIFPGTTCCDARLRCSTPTMMMPTARCCAPPGTALGPTDSPGLCCDPRVLTLPDLSMQCATP